MPKRVPRKPRPKKVGVPKGYDSLWEATLHETVLQEWKHHWDNINYVVKVGSGTMQSIVSTHIYEKLYLMTMS